MPEIDKRPIHDLRSGDHEFTFAGKCCFDDVFTFLDEGGTIGPTQRLLDAPGDVPPMVIASAACDTVECLSVRDTKFGFRFLGLLFEFFSSDGRGRDEAHFQIPFYDARNISAHFQHAHAARSMENSVTIVPSGSARVGSRHRSSLLLMYYSLEF
jgi:hypothetical protein